MFSLISLNLASAVAQHQHEHSDKSKSQQTAMSAPFDLQFIDTMTEHHRMGIEMAKMAASKASHAELKSLARKMIDDQQKDITQMQAWRRQWYSGQPKAVNMEMMKMDPAKHKQMEMDMAKLKKARGHAFDLMFIDTIIPHHQTAIDMSKEALDKGEHQEIKSFAQKTIDSQKEEIDKMSQWKSQWNSEKNATSPGHNHSKKP